MIYGLYNFLRGKHRIFGFRPNTLQVMLAFSFIYWILVEPPFNLVKIFYLAIPLIIIYTGILNKPYLYIYNHSYLFIKKRFFKKSIFIFCKSGSKIQLRRKKQDFWGSRYADGIIIGNTIYIEEFEDYLFKPIRYHKLIDILEKHYQVKKYENFGKFISEEIKSRDNFDMIKKKLLVYNLK